MCLSFTVQEFYDHAEYPNFMILKECLDQKIGFSGCIKSLSIKLKNLCLKYKWCSNSRKFLMERSGIVAAHITFLKEKKYMHSIRNESPNCPVIYLNVTCIFQNH